MGKKSLAYQKNSLPSFRANFTLKHPRADGRGGSPTEFEDQTSCDVMGDGIVISCDVPSVLNLAGNCRHK